VKDPLERISSSQIFKKHKKFFSKSKGREYIRKNLLENLPPLKERIPEDIIEKGNLYYDEKYRKQAKDLGFNQGNTSTKTKGSQRVKWNFSEDWDA